MSVRPALHARVPFSVWRTATCLRVIDMKMIAAVSALLLAACAAAPPDPASAARLQQSIRVSYCGLGSGSDPETPQYRQAVGQCAQWGIAGPPTKPR